MTELEMLEEKAAKLRVLMHEAPMNKLMTNADGHKWIGTNSMAYADRSAEWCKIIQKIKDIKDSQTCGT